MAEEEMRRYVASHPGLDGAACAADFEAHRPGIAREQSTSIYDAWAAAGKYDQSVALKYQGPRYVAEAVGNFFPSDRESQLILDVACGTGFVGLELRKLGFKRLHGLDPSSGMLEVARGKNVYDKDYCCYLDANPLPMDSDIYDCAVSSGGMGEGHIPTKGLRQLTRVVKPGGLVCIVMRELYLHDVKDYRDRLEQEMRDMETQGIWRILSRTVVPKYSFGYNGVLFQFVVC